MTTTDTGVPVRDLGKCSYGEALRVQEDLHARRAADEIDNTLILVEHEPVYTLGRSAERSHVVFSPEQLQRTGISVVSSDRGGDVTYHGPGQLVGYPIVRLERRLMGVLRYVETLEKVLINVLSDFGVTGTRKKVNRGVWVGEEKLAAIGIRVKKHVTMHGFCLNVTTNLDHYSGIIPCGLSGWGVTSLNLLVPGVEMAEVKQSVIRRFSEEFAS
ncbi:MAG: lipoyl(octanoyl) transferase LipB [Kiritimatiellia bacterium]